MQAIEWFEDRNLSSKTGDMKSAMWQFSKDIRPGLALTLKRVKLYTVDKVNDQGETVREGKDTGYRTELEMCGKSLTIAPMKLESNAPWLLDQWIKQLAPILEKYEANPPALTVKTISSPETFVMAVVQSTKYKERNK